MEDSKSVCFHSYEDDHDKLSPGYSSSLEEEPKLREKYAFTNLLGLM